MKEWSDARCRIEGDIARKQEHVREGNNFEKARGFIRRNWSSKNFNPKSNPMEEESSEEEYGEEIDGFEEIPEDEEEADEEEEAFK